MPEDFNKSSLGPIKSPKSTESRDGVLKKDSTTLPKGANKKN